MKLYHEVSTPFVALQNLVARALRIEDPFIFDASTQHHIRQIERRREPHVESKAGRAIPMMAILDRPGWYIATGTQVLLRLADPDARMDS